METEPILKLISKKDFDKVKDKYVDIKQEAQTIIDSSTNELDVLALKVIEGSGFTILNAKIINEENENAFLEILKKGADF